MTNDGKRPKRPEILPGDPMAEAGRKLFARQLRRMKRHEAGSRTGEDIESVHQMRVAIRRMRSLFNLLAAHYRPKTVAKYSKGLRRIARALGAIRDLDVLIVDLQEYEATLPVEPQAALATLIELLDQRRSERRTRLIALFESKSYRRFLRDFRRLCKKPGRGTAKRQRLEAPHQLRHVLPLLLHERMARVKAYDVVLPAAEDETLHALRVEFKQLRYAVELFLPLLGSPAGRFLSRVKAMQEILGRIQDIAVFTGYMSALADLPPEQEAVVEAYVATRNTELAQLRERFDEEWTRFNNRATQRQFSDSLLVLR